ncbi:MAG: hypothetical protein IIZ73_10205 [Ruminococcus sp.]|nr:hypothetical protein [Ruminococcus sp.]
MLKRILRDLGFMLITGSAMFTPIMAAADDGDSTMGAVVGFPVGAVVTGFILVSMSSNKSKATKADKYVEGDLDLKSKEDVFLRTETHKEKVNN